MCGGIARKVRVGVGFGVPVLRDDRDRFIAIQRLYPSIHTTLTRHTQTYTQIHTAHSNTQRRHCTDMRASSAVRVAHVRVAHLLRLTFICVRTLHASAKAYTRSDEHTSASINCTQSNAARECVFETSSLRWPPYGNRWKQTDRRVNG